MTWTTPGTATAGEVLTAAFWNEQVRDNSAAIRDAQVNVVQGLKTDTDNIAVSATSESSNIPGLEATITPTSSTSLVLVSVNVSIAASAGVAMGLVLYRGATAIGLGAAAGSRKSVTVANLGASDAETTSFNYLDNPNTTSATTYGVRIYNARTATTNFYVNRSITDTDNNQYLRSSSMIIVREVPV